MNRDLRFSFLLFLFSLLFRFTSQAQFYPVQSSVVVQGPYTPYLRDYIEGEKLSVSLMLSDPALSFVDAKLQVTLKGVGIEIKTNPSSSFSSIHLTYGTPVVLSSADLSSYFLSSNLLFKGMSVKDYEQKGILSEGLYELKIDVVETTRNKVIGSASATFWAMFQDPPLLSFPAANAQLEASNPVSLLFQWQAMHKIYNGFEVNYVLEIYEVRASDARPINEVVRTSIPIFQTTTTQTSYTYGPSDPVLQTGMKYLWRVQARASASQQNEVFKNNGYSQVSSFEWLSICKPPFNLQVKTNPQGMAYVSFDQGEGAISYKVRVRSMSPITEWIEMETLTPSILINQLALNRPYEVQVSSTCNKRISNYSPSVSFTILSDPKTTTNPSKEPLPKLVIDTSTYLDPLEASLDTEIKVNYYKMLIKTISYDPMTKLYSGTGKVYHPEFGIWISTEFKNIQINRDKVFVVGIIQMVSKQPTQNMLAQVPNRKQPMICVIEDESTQTSGSVGANTSSTGNTSAGNTTTNGQNNTNGTVAAGTTGNSNTSNTTNGNTTAQNGNSGSNNTQTGTSGNNSTQNGTNVNNSTQNTDQQDAIISKDKDKYYIVIDRDTTTKYRYDQDLIFIKQSAKIKLFLRRDSSKVINPAELIWKIDRREIAKGTNNCEIELNSVGNKTVRVYRKTNDKEEVIMRLEIDVYKKPVIVFKRENNYKGEYGFDHAEYKEQKQSGEYEKLNFDGTDYYVPWLTLLSSQIVTLHIDANALALAPKAEKDKDFKIVFRSSDSSKIEINGKPSLSLNYNQLKNSSIKIKTNGLNNFYESPIILEAMDQRGDVIGKINIVSKKENEKNDRSIVFVYVNHGNGYPAISKNTMLEFLNTKSHNQFFRKWVLKTGVINGKVIIDTLNISKEYKANSVLFTKRDWVLNSLSNLYKEKTAIDLSVRYRDNNNNDIRFYFITTIDVPTDNPDKVVGGLSVEKSRVGALFNKGRLEELAHEAGHLLNLHHTFEGDDEGSTTIIIPQGKTENYMDYSTSINMFFLYQWKKVERYIDSKK